VIVPRIAAFRGDQWVRNKSLIPYQELSNRTAILGQGVIWAFMTLLAHGKG
jgi:hypothetical protein